MSARQTAYFVPTKHLNLTDPSIMTQMHKEGDRVSIKLNSQSLARLVECTLKNVDAVFSDNYFDLPAGHPACISVPLPFGWTLSQAKNALEIRSVYDSYTHIGKRK